ncbi:CpaF family protein [Candidatus Woesearchaeota archaeon]|nr:CpaF family protein [Candidatus Woesearchaeota archaeon]
MVNAKVLQYIEEHLRKNVPEAKIVSNLKKAGISERSTRTALKKIHEKVETSIPQTIGEDSSQTAKRFIADELGKGKTKGQVKGELESSGWNKSQVAELLKDTGDKDKTSDMVAKTLLLKKYISSALEKDIDKEALMDTLLGAGWARTQVEAIFAGLDVTEKREAADPDMDEQAIHTNKNITILDEYSFNYMDITVKVIVYSERMKPSRYYHMMIPIISGTTDLILEEIRLKLIDQINLGTLELAEGDFEKLDKTVQNHLARLVSESFAHVGAETQRFLVSYLISKVLGLGIVEIIKADDDLEEIVINRSDDPVYIYHKKWGWCKTNQYLQNDTQIVHLASMTGRKIGREITTLVPLLDAHLPNGDRVNATIKPITVDGPTITIRKFSHDPWTITKFLKTKTMDYTTAALIWLVMQYELSALIVGGTASGKTSALNVLTNLIPPNQRIISIEDTREIRLPRYMHWIPMVSRPPNPEGKGAIEMEDLLVNSLRMRPDRIIVGEVRKKVQAETLFEAIHTGHSCYATFHANNAEEALIRLTNPPVSVPKTMMPAISLMIVQFRNRRTGIRRTFQLAEITKSGEVNVLYQYNPRTDNMEVANKSIALFKTLELYTGNTTEELQEMMNEKIRVLKYLVKHNLEDIEQVGKIMSLYYVENEYLMKDIIGKDKKIG